MSTDLDDEAQFEAWLTKIRSGKGWRGSPPKLPRELTVQIAALAPEYMAARETLKGIRKRVKAITAGTGASRNLIWKYLNGGAPKRYQQ